MNDRSTGRTTADYDPDELLVPAGLPGPVYRIKGDAEAVRARWVRATTWSVGVSLVAFAGFMLVGVYSQSRPDDWNPFADPWLVVGVFGSFYLFQRLVGFFWAKRHADELEPLRWGSVDLDTRLDAQARRESAESLQGQVLAMTVFTVPGLLMLAYLLSRGHSLSFFYGFIIVSILASTLRSFRVYQLRRRREGPPERHPDVAHDQD